MKLRAGLVAAAIALALAFPSTARSDVGLTAAVNAAFTTHVEDAGLHAIAHQRAQEVSCVGCFGHAGQRPGTWEVLVWNQGFGDPVSTAVSQWLSSTEHATILSDPALTRIGCGAVTTSDGRYVAACVLASATSTLAEPGTSSEPVPLLPNTAAAP